MLEVLLWLDRFDLDGKQITTRRLRSLIEDNQMPLRTVERAGYDGECRGHLFPPEKPNTLRIHLKEEERNGPAAVELRIETESDVQKAASYLSSCFVRDFAIYGHRTVLPKSEIIAAPALIRWLDFRNCNFEIGEEDAVSKTLDGSTFRRLVIFYSSVPAWQIDDKRLESLRLRGCDAIHACPDNLETDDDTENFQVTEAGLVNYCFTLDDDLPVPESRTLRITCVIITAAFFKKVVEASKNSQLTCDVDLHLEHLRFDVGNLGLGVPPTRSSEYDQDIDAHVHHVRYSFADHGNGIRLLMHFQCGEGLEEWDVTICHGKKDHEAFFEPQP